ncbi:hypothetical protein [Streptomyces regalis]|uniref:Uncharacterized protein n=1 Tax=Streptomyces regalis TaxID=68262 RepID=A0A101JAI9_9ACTN|nr:hypothetical protein [Streptomyces regalis]KUL23220.1 hypothetical protein ADL12_39770 [Streptomyces regalis]
MNANDRDWDRRLAQLKQLDSALVQHYQDQPGDTARELAALRAASAIERDARRARAPEGRARSCRTRVANCILTRLTTPDIRGGSRRAREARAWKRLNMAAHTAPKRYARRVRRAQVWGRILTVGFAAVGVLGIATGIGFLVAWAFSGGEDTSAGTEALAPLIIATMPAVIFHVGSVIARLAADQERRPADQALAAITRSVDVLLGRKERT